MVFGKVADEFKEVIGKVLQESAIFLVILGIGALLYFFDLDLMVRYAREILILIWPIILAYILFRLFLSMWMHWRQELFIKVATKWKILEIRVPREIRKNPRAMEQVLASLHGMRNVPGQFREIYWDGEITRWFSLEMASFGGEIHFYIRYPARYHTIVQGAFHAYYPDLEFDVVEDYAHTRLPQTMQEVYAKNYELWGTEMVLRKEGGYPIRTYEELEAMAEEKEHDSMSTFLEILGGIEEGKFVGIQILIAPKGPEWADEYRTLVEKLRRPEVKPDTYISPETGEEVSYKPVAIRTPGETDVLEAIERNIGKPAFKTLVRFIYLSPKQLFHDTYPRRGLAGSFAQFNTTDRNGFLQNYDVATRVQFWYFPFLFPGLRGELRKQRILENYIHRDMPPHTFMGKLIMSSPFDSGFKSKTFEMNTECVATIFHPPTFVVLTAPHTKRIESKKVAPPASLPIYGSEEDIEKFL